MKTLLWLDDVRDPHTNDWLNFSPIERPFHVVWVKSYDEFVSFINENSLPDAICFDHDLGGNIAKEKVDNGMSKRQAKIQRRLTMSGYDCAKWLVNYCLDHNLPLPKYNIQSANPVGKENIDKLLKMFN